MLLDLLERLFLRPGDNSRYDVKNRLKLVLAHDRTDLPPEIMEAMRREILEVVSRYVELDTNEMEFALENNQPFYSADRQPADPPRSPDRNPHCKARGHRQARGCGGGGIFCVYGVEPI